MPDYVELPSNALGISYGGNEYYPKSTPEDKPRQRPGVWREVTIRKSKYSHSKLLETLGITQRAYLRRAREGHSEIQWGIITPNKYGHPNDRPEFLDAIKLTLQLSTEDFKSTQHIELSAIVGYLWGHHGSSTYETADGDMRAYKHVDVLEAGGISQWEAVRNLNASKRGASNEE